MEKCDFRIVFTLLLKKLTMQYVFLLGNIFTNTFIFEDVYFFFSLMLTSVNMYVLSIRNLTVALTWAIRRVVLCAFLVSLVVGFDSRGVINGKAGKAAALGVIHKRHRNILGRNGVSNFDVARY